MFSAEELTLPSSSS